MEPVVGEGGQLKVQLSTEKGTTAEIYLHGAHVTSFKPYDSQEVIFVSKEASFKPPSAIRGGIPICWPQFNDLGITKAHGFARNLGFAVVEQAKDKVVLVLSTSQETKLMITQEFELEVVVAVSDENGGTFSQTWHHILLQYKTTDLREKLFMQVTCKNTGSEELPTTQALHTYFCVSDIANISVTGLESSAYLDNLADRAEQPATGAPITVSEEVDRIYTKTGDTIVLRDVGAQREVVLEKEGFEDVVVWNPWIEKAAKTKDFGNEEYKIMMCLEAANAAVYTRGSSIEIPGGGTWTASQRVHVRPIQS